MPREEKKLAPASSVIYVYWTYARKHWALLSLVLLFTVAIQAANLAAPLFLRTFFNTLVLNKPSAALVGSLTGILGFVVLMWIINWAATRAQDASNIFYSAKIMQNLYANAFEYLISHSYNFFISNFAGTLTHRVSRFARSFEVISDAIIIQFLPTGIFILGASAVLFERSPLLGIALFLWSIAFVWFQTWIAKMRQPSRNARADAESKVTGVLADAIGNQATVIQFSGAAHEKGIFKNTVDLWRKATLRSWLLDSLTWGIIGLFVIGIQAGLLFGAIILWRQGTLTVGDFVLIQSYLLGAFGQLMGIGYQLRRFYDAFADAGEMVYILDLPHEIQDIPGAGPLSVTKGEIRLRNVVFSFQERRVLHDFNVSIAGGQKVALVGPSGAGKSTITKLLLRLYDVQSGAIEIDGQNIAGVTQDSLHNAVAFVPQEPILFHRSLMENIRYGRRDATDEEVIEAAKKAHCHQFISELQEGYATYVGERGVKLSGGERQRVAIARAILKNAPLLVLDEATSSLDSQSEALIQDALATLMQGKTVVVIAHRLSTIMKMDRILVIEQGRVIADGTHQQLIREGGLYQKLWNIQAGGFLLAGTEPAVEEIPEGKEEKEEETEYPEDSEGLTDTGPAHSQSRS